ncbi:MAG TPA: hypothetical protein VHM88_24725 [Candidatus Acidoferrales bacterium]|jgi:hypothetical protein|nr:hypothetical protein [Candidatus Acidoferrales bacterium]
MENVMERAELVAVMVLSLSLALGLVWLSLLGAFQLLPGSTRHVRTAARPTHEIFGGLRWAAAHSKGLPEVQPSGLRRRP